MTSTDLHCPECGEPVWDGPHGYKLAKCWNTEGHASGRTLAFDTMTDDDVDAQWDAYERAIVAEANAAMLAEGVDR